MSAQYNQNWTRGFGPWFTGPASDQHMRVSDAERQAVADRLAEHFSSGRLDQAEFDERVGRAMSAKTRADLNGLFDDLPETGAPAATDPAGPTGQPRRRHRHPVLLVALIVFVAIAAGARGLAAAVDRRPGRHRPVRHGDLRPRPFGPAPLTSW